MTLPSQRYHAIRQARQLMLFLAHCDEFSDAVHWHRSVDYAREILQHYPSRWDIESLAQAVPNLICNKTHPLYQMCAQYNLDSLTDIDL